MSDVIASTVMLGNLIPQRERLDKSKIFRRPQVLQLQSDSLFAHW